MYIFFWSEKFFLIYFVIEFLFLFLIMLKISITFSCNSFNDCFSTKSSISWIKYFFLHALISLFSRIRLLTIRSNLCHHWIISLLFLLSTLRINLLHLNVFLTAYWCTWNSCCHMHLLLHLDVTLWTLCLNTCWVHFHISLIRSRWMHVCGLLSQPLLIWS